MSNELLAELNAFRANEGKAPLADWRRTRHQPMLDEYRAKRVTYKAMRKRGNSKVAGPVARVHAFLSANVDMTRKNAIAALIAQGVTYWTARTQYQRWHSAMKAAMFLDSFGKAA